MLQNTVQISTQISQINAPQTWRNPNDHWRIALRNPWYLHLVQIQHQIFQGLHRFFSNEGLITFCLPVTTGSISSPMGLGSDSLPVEIDLLGAKTFLADSMQFMLEHGCRMHRQGVYYIMPSFRGEETDRLHLAQFCHAEAEIPGTLSDVVDLASKMVHFISEWLLTHCTDSIIALAGNVTHIETLLKLNGIYPQIRLSDALDLLRNNESKWINRHPAGFELPTKDGERALYENWGPFWLTHFDQLSVPFYQAQEEGTKQALNADFILGGCETIGSGQRHLSMPDARKALELHQVSSDPYEWYLAMRSDSPMQTSGFGMGIERYLLWLLQHDDIRDMMILYRENGKNFVP